MERRFMLFPTFLRQSILPIVMAQPDKILANRTGPTKHRKEHKGANLFKNTRISTTRDKDFNNKGPQRTQEYKVINTRDQFT